MNVMTAVMLFGGYLLGSVSGAIIFCRVAGLPDPRLNGSTNPGATNVLRLGGRLSAFGVLLFDMFKGLLPVALGAYVGLPASEIGWIAVATCLGHIFPLFFRFQGGKGVATAFGAILPMGTAIAGFALGCWVLVFLLSGYASLSAVVTALLLPAVVWWFKPEFTLPIAFICCLLVYRHHDNIQRLWRGQEERIWKKR